LDETDVTLFQGQSGELTEEQQDSDVVIGLQFLLQGLLLVIVDFGEQGVFL